MATLTEQLQADLTAAMKERDALVTSTLRLLRAAVQTAEVAGDEAVTLGDEAVLAVIASEARKRSEAADVYESAGRAELAAKERAELAVLERYLPAALGDDELAALVDDEVTAAAAAGNTGMRAMGTVVKAVRDRAGSSADGAKIAALVKSALSTAG